MWYDTATPERIAQRQSFMRQDGYKTKISKMIKEKWKNKKYREMMLRARLK
jgi:hypothetical protein